MDNSNISFIEFMKLMINQGYCSTTQANYCIDVSLGNLPQAVPHASACTTPVKKAAKSCDKEGNNPMYTDNETKNYLLRRIEGIYVEQDKKLQFQFGLRNDPAPRTAAEMVARIQAGQFVLPSSDNDYGHGSIEWRNPSVKKDRAGFDAAYAALKVQKTDTTDTVMVASDADGLTAVQALQAWTYTAPTSPSVSTSA